MVLHTDGDPLNNRLENLRWGSAAENSADMVRHGRSCKGERHPMAKLTAAQAADVRRRYAAGEKQRDIGRAFGIHQAQVHRICAGKTWQHVGGVPRAEASAA